MESVVLFYCIRWNDARKCYLLLDFSSKSILLELILQNTKANELLIRFIPEVQPEGLQAI